MSANVIREPGSPHGSGRSGGCLALSEIGGLATPEVALPHPLGSGRLNPTDHGRDVFDLQRAGLDLNADGTWTSIVGGFAEVVTVSRAGIERRRLIDWTEDVVGERNSL